MAIATHGYADRIQRGRVALQVVAEHYALSPEATRAAQLAFNENPTEASYCYLSIAHSLKRLSLPQPITEEIHYG